MYLKEFHKGAFFLAISHLYLYVKKAYKQCYMSNVLDNFLLSPQYCQSMFKILF